MFDYIPKELTYVQLRVEPRVYFAMPRGIRAGQSANNFSGNYLGLEVSRAELFGQSGESHALPERERTVTLRFGIQRRLFRFGYFDLSYGLGWRSWEQKFFYQNTPRQEFFANARVAIGVAFATGGRRRAGQTASWCDIIRCFREESHTWRIDLFRTLVLDNAREIQGELPVAYEKKIGSSPLSVELEGRLIYGHTRSYGNIYTAGEHINWIGGGLAIEPRYYFTLKKRLARGHSGDNLSGPFLALRLQGRLENAGATGGVDFTQTTKQVVALPLFGVQYRILRNGFIAYKIGAGVAFTGINGSHALSNGEPSMDMYWLSELKVGLAF